LQRWRKRLRARARKRVSWQCLRRHHQFSHLYSRNVYGPHPERVVYWIHFYQSVERLPSREDTTSAILREVIGGWLTLRAKRELWVAHPLSPSPAKGAIRPGIRRPLLILQPSCSASALLASRSRGFGIQYPRSGPVSVHAPSELATLVLRIRPACFCGTRAEILVPGHSPDKTPARSSRHHSPSPLSRFSCGSGLPAAECKLWIADLPCFILFTS